MFLPTKYVSHGRVQFFKIKQEESETLDDYSTTQQLSKFIIDHSKKTDRMKKGAKWEWTLEKNEDFEKK